MSDGRQESEGLHVTRPAGPFWLHVVMLIAVGGMAFLFALRVVG